jgi:hypothetical protein
VEGWHTYYVGDEGWAFDVLAHNANKTCLVGNHDGTDGAMASGRTRRRGRQSHHLNQNAAYNHQSSNLPGNTGRKIPYGEGATVSLQVELALWGHNITLFIGLLSSSGIRPGSAPNDGCGIHEC